MKQPLGKTTDQIDKVKPPSPETVKPPFQEPLIQLLHRAERTPGSITPGDVNRLQRTLGNQALGQMGQVAGRAAHNDNNPTAEGSLNRILEKRSQTSQGQVSLHQAVDNLRLNPGDAFFRRGENSAETTTGGKPLIRLSPLSGSAVQRAVVKDDAVKLDFFIRRLGTITKGYFTNALPEQVEVFIQQVNQSWKAAYAENDNLLDAKKAASVLKMKELLQTLGKNEPIQEDYRRLSVVINETFDDEADIEFDLAYRKESKPLQYPPGYSWWLDQLNEEGLILPEDKSNDHRLVTSRDNNIVKTNADTAETATSLYEIDQQQSGEREINEDDRTWELHAHVKKSGDVAFAHTKVNGSHAVEVNDWFDQQIDKDERKWS